MITSKTMYQLHNSELEIKITDINNQIQSLKEYLSKYKKTINYYNTTILESDLFSGTYEILNPKNNIEKYISINLIAYNKTLKNLNEKTQIKKELEEYKIKETIFCYILRRFNTLLYKEILYNNYIFKNLFLGGFSVICAKNTKNVIDWKKSNENKNKILEQGLTPFLKKDKELAEQQNLEYKGVNWIEYITDYRLFYNWELENAQFIRIPNIKNFTFIPLRGKKSAVQELTILTNSLTEEERINKYKIV